MLIHQRWFTAALTAVEDKMPNVSNLVKKADYDAKISEMEKEILLLLIIINLQKVYWCKDNKTKIS